MRIHVRTAELARAAALAARHASPRPALPVLAGVRLTARDGEVSVAGYDFEAGSTATVPAEVETPGEVLVPGRVFADILRLLPADEVTVARKDGSVYVEAPDTEFTLPVLPLEEYPAVPGPAGRLGDVPAGALGRAVASVTRVALRDESVPLLSGVYVEARDDALGLMATDRYRIALHELPWQPARDAGTRATAVVPGRLLADAVKGLSGDGDLTVGLGDGRERRISLARPGATATARLLDGTYPDVLRGMPAAFAGRVVVDREALLQAVRRIALVADQYAAVVLDVGADSVAVTATSDSDMGGRARLPAVRYDEPARLAVNSGYLLDGLAALDTPYARISYQRQVRPALIEGCADPRGEDVDARRRYYMMPRTLPA